MKLDFFNPEIVGTITSDKIIYKKKYASDGLFSEQIFGPVNDYTCQCGVYSIYGGRCKKCGVEYTSSEERMNRFAKIDLPMKVVYPPFTWIVRQNKSDDLLQILNYSKYLVKLSDTEFEILDTQELIDNNSSELIDTNNRIFGAEALEIIFNIMEKEEREDLKSFKSHKLYNLWKKYKDNFFINYVIVVPPGLRPVIKKSNTVFLDDLNRLYSVLINKAKIISERKFIHTIDTINLINLRTLQKVVNDIYLNIFSIFGGKTGLFRGNTLGKRIDFSGRAVIVPDPSLKIDEVRISYYILLEIYKFEIVRKLSIEENQLFFEVLEKIENELTIKDYKFRFLKELNEIIKDKVVILNRQPTLHKHSALAHKIVIGLDECISIHPLICHCYNADFDGDQMAVYFPITIEAIEDIKNKMLCSKNLFLEGSGDLAYQPSQDIIYGIYLASISKDKEKILPKPLLNYMKQKGLDRIHKKDLLLFLNKYIRKTKNVNILDEIKDIGFSFSSQVEIDVSLEALKRANINKEEKQKLLEVAETGSVEEYQKVEKEIIKNVIKRCSFSDIVLSGSRGSLDQLKQLFVAKGYVADSENNIMDKPITTSLIDGLNSKELFLSSYGVRKGLSDIADSTARSGVFCRTLVYMAINTVRNRDKEYDCHPTRWLEIDVNTPELAKSLIDRYLSFTKEDFLSGKYIYIDPENAIQLVGKKVYLRSPLFCKSKHLCQKCAPGESRNIGVNAALSLGERSTQLVLRTFHTSGVITGKQKDDSKNKDITSDLSVVTKMFSDPRFTLENIEEYILTLFSIFKNYGILRLLNFEVLVSNLMWVDLQDEIGNEYKDLWRLHQTMLPTLVGMNQVPQQYSFLVSAAFGHFKRKIISSIGKEIGDSIFDRILLGTF